MSKFVALFVILAIAFVLPSVVLADGPDVTCHNPTPEPTEDVSTPEPENPPETENPPESTPEPQPTEELTPEPTEPPWDIDVPVIATPSVPVGIIDNPTPRPHSDEMCGNGESCDNEEVLIIPSTETPLTESPMILPETGGVNMPAYFYLLFAGLALLILAIGINTYVLVSIKRIK